MLENKESVRPRVLLLDIKWIGFDLKNVNENGGKEEEDLEGNWEAGKLAPITVARDFITVELNCA